MSAIAKRAIAAAIIATAFALSGGTASASLTIVADAAPIAKSEVPVAKISSPVAETTTVKPLSRAASDSMAASTKPSRRAAKRAVSHLRVAAIDARPIHCAPLQQRYPVIHGVTY